MTELSPAAQAVFDAYANAPCRKPRETWLAAALRAVADAKATEVSVEGHYRTIVDVDDILAIADELESHYSLSTLLTSEHFVLS